MPKALDLSTLDPKRAQQILSRRAHKKAEYQRRRDELLARKKTWRDGNLETSRAISREWKKSNPEAVVQSRRTYYEENRDGAITRARLQGQRNRAHLSDRYLKQLYRKQGLATTDVTQEMLDTMRSRILAKRAAKAAR